MDLEGVSMRMRGTESVNELEGKRVGRSNGGTEAGKESEAMAEMRVVLPADLSPTMTILTSLRIVVLRLFAIGIGIEKTREEGFCVILIL